MRRLLHATGRSDFARVAHQRPLPALMRLSAACLTLCSLTLAAPASLAGGEPAWSLNGFANLGVARSSFDDARYRYVPTADAEIGTAPSPRIDSLAGVQLRYEHSDTLHFTAQLLAREAPVEGAPLIVNWAYLGWQASDRTEIKLGRIMLPFFMFSDTRHVRYAQPWVRPPAEVYSLVANNENHDGAYLRNLMPVGAWTCVTELFVGMSDDRNRNTSLSNTAYGVALSAYDAHWTVRLMWLDGTTKIDSPLLGSVLSMLQQRAPDVAADYAYEKLEHTGYHTFGVRYEDDQWLLLGEVAGTRTGGSRMLGDDVGAYLTVGRRFGAWQPYLGYAWRRSNDLDPDARITDPVAARVTAQLLAAQNYSQDTATLGLRWDLALNFALKAQFDRVTPRDGARGSFAQALPAGRRYSDVLSVAANLIF